MNNLYTLQAGIGHEHLLLPAVVDGNLSVSFRYSYGVSLAMLKPYYLKLVYLDPNNNNAPYLKEEKYSDANRDKFLNSGAILGASKWGKSLGEIDYVPGIYLDACIVIEPAKSKSFVQAISLGINGAFYAKDLPIMVDQPAYPYQASLYAGLALGKRWEK